MNVLLALRIKMIFKRSYANILVSFYNLNWKKWREKQSGKEQKMI